MSFREVITNVPTYTLFVFLPGFTFLMYYFGLTFGLNLP